MSVSDLKAQLADIPGIQGLTMTTVAGRDNYGFDGLLVSLDPTMGQDEVAAHIRIAFAARKPRPPIVNFTTETPLGKPMSVTGATYAGSRLKDQLAGIKAKIAKGQDKMAEALDKMNIAAEAHNELADTVASEADSLLADIGQFKNG